jgi:hypothetical protein
MGNETNGNGRFLPDMSQYVTFKWLMGAAAGLCLGGAAVTASAMIYMNKQFEAKAAKSTISELTSRLEVQQVQYNSDIEWIKRCMVQKCWDKPRPP